MGVPQAVACDGLLNRPLEERHYGHSILAAGAALEILACNLQAVRGRPCLQWPI